MVSLLKKEEERILVRLSCFIRTEEETHYQGLSYPIDKRAWQAGIYNYSLLELAESLEIKYGDKLRAKSMPIGGEVKESWCNPDQNQITVFLWTLNYISGTIIERGSIVIKQEDLELSSISSLGFFSLDKYKLGPNEFFEIVIVDGTLAGPKEREVFKNLFRYAFNV